MKLTQITEMAAKKLCDKCGKTMAANHYWYKGGWRCKKSATADGTPNAAPSNGAAPMQKPGVKSSGITVDHVRANLRDMGWNPENTDDEVYWQVSKNVVGNIFVVWDITFRRNTLSGAFQDYSQQISRANQMLKKLAATYPDAVVSIYPVTAETVRRDELRRQMNGNDLYSEYEQSLGGSIELKG